MTDTHTDPGTAEVDPPPFRPAPRNPYAAAFTGFNDAPDSNWGPDDWPNCVMVDVREGYARTLLDVEGGYADAGEVRCLVEIDTNYKDTRRGEHPVSLTRRDAVNFAAAVLRAVAGTFDAQRVGTLRPTEAVELLTELGSVEGELMELREQALGDLRYELVEKPVDDGGEVETPEEPTAGGAR